MINVHCVPWVMTTSDRRYSFWVLHNRPFRNTSLILELFTAEHGRVGVVLRGGRRNSLITPFRPLNGQLKGKGELLTLAGCEPDGGSAVMLSGKALYCGLYLNELLVRLLHRHDPHPTLLPVYEQTLHMLSAPDVPLDIVLRRFERSLLDELGYGFSLADDIHGDSIKADFYYTLDPEKGLLPTGHGWSGKDLQAIVKEQWNDNARRVAREIMRLALAAHLGDKPLTSRELFRADSDGPRFNSERENG